MTRAGYKPGPAPRRTSAGQTPSRQPHPSTSGWLLPSVGLTGCHRLSSHSMMPEKMVARLRMDKPASDFPSKMTPAAHGTASSGRPKPRSPRRQARHWLDFAHREFNSLTPRLRSAQRHKLESHYALVQSLTGRLEGMSSLQCSETPARPGPTIATTTLRCHERAHRHSLCLRCHPGGEPLARRDANGELEPPTSPTTCTKVSPTKSTITPPSTRP